MNQDLVFNLHIFTQLLNICIIVCLTSSGKCFVYINDWNTLIKNETGIGSVTWVDYDEGLKFQLRLKSVKYIG